MGKANSKEVKWALSNLAEDFSARGWKRALRVTSELEMSRNPAEQIRHGLLIMEAPAIDSPPQKH